jgi:outer membrane lipoprotein LolB
MSHPSPRGAPAALALLFLAGCASVSPPVNAPPAALVAQTGDGPFTVAGRLSARRGADGIAANFVLTHEPPEDRIDLATPLGQVIARLEGDTTGVRVERADGTSTRYADWTALTNSQFGVTIPVDGLSMWIRGAARPGQQSSMERDAFGRALVLRQQAWEIVYAYPDDAPATLPSRVTLRFPDEPPVEVRIVVDRWVAADAKR